MFFALVVNEKTFQFCQHFVSRFQWLDWICQTGYLGTVFRHPQFHYSLAKYVKWFFNVAQSTLWQVNDSKPQNSFSWFIASITTSQHSCCFSEFIFSVKSSNFDELAIEHGPFIVDVPTKNSDFPIFSIAFGYLNLMKATKSPKFCLVTAPRSIRIPKRRTWQTQSGSAEISKPSEFKAWNEKARWINSLSMDITLYITTVTMDIMDITMDITIDITW